MRNVKGNGDRDRTETRRKKSRDARKNKQNNYLSASIGGATPKFLGGPNLRPTTDVLQAIYGL